MLTRSHTAPSAVPKTSGFSLIELLIALVLLGIILGTLMSMLVRQQAFYRTAEGLLNSRGQLRQALAVLPADLRAIAPKDGDVYALSDHMIEFRSTLGSSILCREDSSTAFALPPTTLNRNNGLTLWLTQPVAGDSMLVLDEGASSATTSDDVWRKYAILSITPVTGTGAGAGCTTASGFVQGSDTARSSYRITVAAGTPLASSIVLGAPIRFFRRARYELYQAPDNKWYLGYFDCLPSRPLQCNVLSMLSGPYLPYVNSTSSGLLLTYYDSTGAALSATIANAPNMARIRLQLYAQTSQVNISGGNQGPRTDSMSMSIGLRNRR